MAYYFNLPIFDDLTLDQQRAIDDTSSALALSGGPGTGKSVVCLWRHINNHATGVRNSLLLTYTKTLEHYLRVTAESRSSDAGKNIDRVFWWLQHNAQNYDEIIIDEGQDIEKGKFERFFTYSKNISYGADERQSMYLKEDKLKELFKWFLNDSRFRKNEKVTLNRNFRNSKEILLFVQSFFPTIVIPFNTIIKANQTNLKPIVKLNLGWGTENQIDEIIGIINDFNSDTHNIAILVPFAAQVETYYALLRTKIDRDISISKYQNEMSEFGRIEGVHVTTFKSSKGTEFDTVILPEFDNYTWSIENRPNVVTDNDYYVALTRAKINLFLLYTNSNILGDKSTVTIE